MKDSECARCKRMFTCAGKPTSAPCNCFEDRWPEDKEKQEEKKNEQI